LEGNDYSFNDEPPSGGTAVNKSWRDEEAPVA
jgi:hypothetical protein